MNVLLDNRELAAYEGFSQVTASWQLGFRSEEGHRTSEPTGHLSSGGVKAKGAGLSS